VGAWNLAGAVAGGLLATLYFLAANPLVGSILLAFTAAWLAYRVRVVRDVAPGSFAFARALEDAARAAVAWLSLLLVCALLFVAAAQHWGKTVPGLVAILALAALVALLAQECEHRLDSAFARHDGGLAEERVRAALGPLEELGWSLTTNLMRDDVQCDIDVVVRAPSRRVYAIETKASSSGFKGLGQAIGNAVWLRRRYPKAGYVNAVVCVLGDRPPKQYGSGWIVGIAQLADWLATDPGRS
jgi:hypothetical protein